MESCLKKNIDYSKLKFSICIFSSIIFLLNLYLLKKVSPLGYDIDIYSQFPSLFWYNSIIIYFIGCLLILDSEKKFNTFGIIISLLNHYQIYLIPYMLGYFSYGTSDELSHIGEFQNIVLSGHFSSYNIYPAAHIIYSTVSLTSGIKPNIVSLILPSFFSMLFIIGIFIFSKYHLYSNTYLFNKNTLSIVYLISLIYFFGHFHFSNVPNYTYFTLMPIFLYSFNKYLESRTFSISVVLTLFMLVIPFTHPFISLFVLFAFLALFTAHFLNLIKVPHIRGLFSILLCTFFMWVLNSRIVGLFNTLYAKFSAHEVNPVVIEGMNGFSKINLGWGELLQLIYIYSARYVIPLMFITVFLCLIYKKKIYFENNGLKTISLLSIIMLIFGVYQLILLLNSFISHGVDRITNLNYVIFPMIPLFALSLSYISNTFFKYRSKVAISVALTIIFISSIYGALYSPYIFQANIAGTYNEVHGMSWLFENKNEMPIYDLIGDVGYRYSSLINNWSNTNERFGKDILWASGKVPDHLGYNKNNFFSNSKIYIVFTTKGELLYLTIYQKIGRYFKNDFDKFRNDPYVSKIYDNKNIEIYFS